MKKSARVYMVVGRSRASAFIAQNSTLHVETRLGTTAADISFRSNFLETEYSVPVPVDLWVECRGLSEDLESAIRNFANAARTTSMVLSVSANAFIDPPDIEIAYDVTPNIKERDFFQRYVPAEKLTIFPYRRINLEATSKLISEIGGNSSCNRIMAAVAQYARALEEWTPGSELICIAHLFMGMEALKDVAVKVYLNREGITEEELGRRWNFSKTGSMTLPHFLQQESRRRLLFKNDETCHRRAKQASDVFEHGYANYGEQISVAREVLLETASYLRSAIFDFSGLPNDSISTLLSPPYDIPRGPLKTDRYLWGRLNAKTEDLAKPGFQYPMCTWRVELQNVSINKLGEYSMTITDQISPLLNDGISLKVERHEVWDGSTIRDKQRLEKNEKGMGNI